MIYDYNEGTRHVHTSLYLLLIKPLTTYTSRNTCPEMQHTPSQKSADSEPLHLSATPTEMTSL